jgi:hypothetical protein
MGRQAGAAEKGGLARFDVRCRNKDAGILQCSNSREIDFTHQQVPQRVDVQRVGLVG